MAYPGVCNKFGMLQVMAAGYFLPLAIELSVRSSFSTGSVFFEPDFFIKGAIPNPFILILTGAFGFAAGAVMHGVADRKAHRNRMGMSEGSAYVRKAQIKAYASMLICSVGFNVAAAVASPQYAQARKQPIFRAQKAELASNPR